MRKVGGTTLRSIGDIARHQSLEDNDETFVAPNDMLLELVADNKTMAAAMRKAHAICDEHGDVGTASLLETFIDATERRTWFLFEATRSRRFGPLRRSLVGDFPLRSDLTVERWRLASARRSFDARGGRSCGAAFVAWRPAG